MARKACAADLWMRGGGCMHGCEADVAHLQQGARPFFATMALEDSHRVRMGAMHYLKAGTSVSQRFVMQRWLP